MKNYLQLIAEIDLTQSLTGRCNKIYHLIKIIIDDTEISLIESNVLIKKLANLL